MVKMDKKCLCSRQNMMQLQTFSAALSFGKFLLDIKKKQRKISFCEKYNHSDLVGLNLSYLMLL